MKKYQVVEKMVRFKSSLVLAAKYHYTTKYLDIYLNDSGCGFYRYYNIPVQTFNNLLNSKSKGVYFNKHIRNKYDYWNRNR